LFALSGQKNGYDLWARQFVGEDKTFPITQRESDQFAGNFSPDGHWIVFESNESGRSEVYVQAFPQSGEKWQISLEGGGDPRWRADGKEVFYVALDGTLMSATVSVAPGSNAVKVDKPQLLFQTPLTVGRGRPHGYAVSRDGQRFLMPIPLEKNTPPITILLNWADR